MSYTITSFSGNTTPTGPQLDNNFNAMALQSITPCTVTGTNALTLTGKTNTFTIAAYDQNLRLAGVAASTNTNVTTARYGSLGFLKVYRDTPAGPVQCTGGEIVADCAFTLMYDSALDSGNGGFHLFASTQSLSIFGGTVTGNLAVSGTLTAASLASVARLMVGTSAATITRILSAVATLTYSVTSANGSQDQNMSVPGAQLGDVVSLGVTATPSGAGFVGYIPANGTVAVRLLNASTVTLATVVPIVRARVESYT